MCDGSVRILGAGRIRQCSGKSKVKLTWGRPEGTILGGLQSGSRCWRRGGGGGVAVERIFASLRERSRRRTLLILFPATTSLEAISLIWLSCSGSGQVPFFPSGILRWKKHHSLNSPYMTEGGKTYSCCYFPSFSSVSIPRNFFPNLPSNFVTVSSLFFPPVSIKLSWVSFARNRSPPTF